MLVSFAVRLRGLNGTTIKIETLYQWRVGKTAVTLRGKLPLLYIFLQMVKGLCLVCCLLIDIFRASITVFCS